MLKRSWIRSLSNWLTTLSQHRSRRHNPQRNRSRQVIEALECRMLLSGAPVVTSINLVGPATTDANKVTFTATFSEPVTGVDPTDFALVKTGTVDAKLTQVTAVSQWVYTVTVSGVTGSGTLGLNLVDDSSIRNMEGTKLTKLTFYPSFKSGIRFTTEPYESAPYSNAVALGDVNGDAKTDLIILNGSIGESVGVLLGNGDGSFQIQHNFDGGYNVSSVTIGDVNGQPASVNYASVGAGVWKFQFTNADGTTREATYRAGGRNGGSPPRNNPAPENQRGPRPDNSRGGAVTPVIINAKHSGNFILTSSVVTNGGALPVEFTGDGASASPPLEWSGAPADTKCFAVIMDHFPGPGDVKWYWTLYNIPASVHNLPKNASGSGVAGNNSVNRNLVYAPPHSKGPGAKTYFITVYALSALVQISLPPSQVSRNVLLTAMKDLVLDSAQLKFTYDRTRFIQQNGDDRPPRRDDSERPNP